jgi:hypothetical protein
MESLCAGPFVLLLVGGGLLLALGAGAVVLIKLGVLARYAVKEETPDEGTYGLDESRDVDDY